MDNVSFSAFHNIGLYLINPMHQDLSNCAITPVGVHPGYVKPMPVEVESDETASKLTSQVMPDSPLKITEAVDIDSSSQMKGCCIIS